ncbi:MAG: TfoX/Sxy family protein [Eggerthellaceae bacterium]|nr:TfoX/Sxy family protein [Eggerthellaceae bacterium]MDR2716235.1 TfoX/Sxy family protein [Coriobacteriaceae bacterium]
MAELGSLRNIGKEIGRKLESVGISTAEGLREVGSREAFLRLKLHYPNVCLVHLYALEGAVAGVEYRQLPEEVKRGLKDYSDSLK